MGRRSEEHEPGSWGWKKAREMWSDRWKWEFCTWGRGMDWKQLVSAREWYFLIRPKDQRGNNVGREIWGLPPRVSNTERPVEEKRSAEVDAEESSRRAWREWCLKARGQTEEVAGLSCCWSGRMSAEHGRTSQSSGGLPSDLDKSLPARRLRWELVWLKSVRGWEGVRAKIATRNSSKGILFLYYLSDGRDYTYLKWLKRQQGKALTRASLTPYEEILSRTWELRDWELHFSMIICSLGANGSGEGLFITYTLYMYDLRRGFGWSFGQT